MTYGKEPRRRRRQDSSRQAEHDDVEDWLAGYRPSAEERKARPRSFHAEDDAGGSSRPLLFDEPPQLDEPAGRDGSFLFETTPPPDAPPRREDRSRRGERPRAERPPRTDRPPQVEQPRRGGHATFDVPSPFDGPTPSGSHATGDLPRFGGHTGSFASTESFTPTGSFTPVEPSGDRPRRRRARADDGHPPVPPAQRNGGAPDLGQSPYPEPITAPGRPPRAAPPQPSRAAHAQPPFAAPPQPPPAAPPQPPRATPPQPPRATPPQPPRATPPQASRAAAPLRAGEPELRPIIEPLPEFPPRAVPTTPPPLVPIMPKIGPTGPSSTRRLPRSLRSRPPAPPNEFESTTGFQPAAPSFDRETTGFQPAAPSFDRETTGFQPAAPSFDRETTGFQPAAPSFDRPPSFEQPAPRQAPPPRSDVDARPPVMDAATGLLPPPVTDRPPATDTPPHGIARQARPPVDDRIDLTPPPPSRWGTPDAATTGSGRVPPFGSHSTIDAPEVSPISEPTPTPLEPPVVPTPRPGRRGPVGAGSFRISPPKLAGAHHATRWKVAIGAILAVVVLAGCGLGGYMMIKDESNKGNAKPNVSASPQPRDISSQAVDPVPLTVQEVFAGQEIKPVPNEPGYQVLKTQDTADCKVAATDELGALLVNMGCTQVVRATLKHPTGQYLITAGLFNLKDETNAQQAREGIEPNINAQKGRFTGLMAGNGTEAIVRAPTQLGWDYRGHYLAWCVIARTDGQPFADGDGYPKQIIFDVVGTHLLDGVIGARSAPKAQASTPASPGVSTTPAK